MTADEKQALETKLIESCSVQEKATAADITEIRSGKMPTSYSAKCIHACILETLGLVMVFAFLFLQSR